MATDQHRGTCIDSPLRSPVAASFPPNSWTIRRGDYPDQMCVHTLFEQWAAATPDAPAIVSETGCLTYGELNARANRVAHFLRTRQVGPDTPVAICTERSFEMIVGQLGILKAGGVYVPLDPSYPAERLAFMVEETRVPVLLIESHLRASIPAKAAEVICLDENPPELAGQSVENPALNTTSANLAYIIYTSGSTGRPKGASIPHRGISRLVRGQNYVPFGPEERVLLLASPSFDGIIFELWAALLNGGCCVIFPDRMPEFGRLEEIIRKQHVTCLWLTTGLFNQIIDFRPGTIATARNVMVGGEALSPQHVRRAQEILPQVRLVNGYGPTECTAFACVYPIAPADEWGCASVPIGGPINNTECHIVDDALRAVPIGEPGELLLGGPGLAREYFLRPELTEEKFVRHPFSDDPSARLYRTGDRCRWLPNGLIEYLGRNDNQIKLRGFRIELGEIETALRSLSGVLDAAVVVRQLASIKQLVGFVVPAAGANLVPSDLRAKLGSLLPEPAVPAFIRLIERLPLTANGKVDRRQLSELAETSQASAFRPEDGASVSQLEKTLLSIWRKVLEQPHIGLEDNFFENGGDSLLSIQLALEIQSALERPIPVGAVYLAPSPAAFARKLTSGLDDLADFSPCGRQNQPTLFYIPGVDGACKLPASLAELIQDTHSHYDRLQYPGLDGTSAPLTSVEELATEMIRQIRQVRPTGPYYLCGYSMGGTVAHEIACQLADEGSVKKIILWDSIPPPNIVGRSAPGIVWAMIQSVFSAPPDRKSELATEHLKVIGQRFERFMPAWALPAPQGDASPPSVAQLVENVSYAAYLKYTPKTHEVPVVLFRCLQPSSSVFLKITDEPDHGWKKWAHGPLVIHEIDCEHLDLLKPPMLAQVMAQTAAELQT